MRGWSRNKKINKLFVFFVCCVYYEVTDATASIPKTKINVSTDQNETYKVHLLKSQLRSPKEDNNIVIHKFLSSTLKPHSLPFIHKPEVADDSLIIPNINNNKTFANNLPATKISNFDSRIKTNASKRETAKKPNSYKPSLLGSIFLYLITLFVAASLFVMLACFMHKWRENMGTNTNYPKIEYSMLRQGEDEPEDPMGEILVNIGLALPEDICPLSETESETDDSKIPSLEPSLLHEVIPNEFTTISLDHEDSGCLLPKPSGDESDEELLQ